MRQCTPPARTQRHAAAFQRRVAPYGRVKCQSSPALQEIREKIPFTAAAPRPRRPCQCTLVGAACPCAALFSAVPRPTGASTPTHIPTLQEITQEFPFTAAAPRPHQPRRCTLLRSACPAAAPSARRRTFSFRMCIAHHSNLLDPCHPCPETDGRRRHRRRPPNAPFQMIPEMNMGTYPWTVSRVYVVYQALGNTATQKSCAESIGRALRARKTDFEKVAPIGDCAPAGRPINK